MKHILLATALIATITNTSAATEWRRAAHIAPTKHTVWMPPVRVTGEIPYGCRTRFDDLLPRACLVLPTETCFIFSPYTEKETDGKTKAQLKRICDGWFHATDDYPLQEWQHVEGRYPSQSVPKLPQLPKTP